MKGLINLIIGIALCVVSVLLIIFIVWLISDVDYTWKQCVQHPICYLIGIILSVGANIAYFDED